VLYALELRYEALKYNTTKHNQRDYDVFLIRISIKKGINGFSNLDLYHLHLKFSVKENQLFFVYTVLRIITLI